MGKGYLVVSEDMGRTGLSEGSRRTQGQWVEAPVEERFHFGRQSRRIVKGIVVGDSQAWIQVLALPF